jgi:hypothetical protein
LFLAAVFHQLGEFVRAKWLFPLSASLTRQQKAKSACYVLLHAKHGEKNKQSHDKSCELVRL